MTPSATLARRALAAAALIPVLAACGSGSPGAQPGTTVTVTKTPGASNSPSPSPTGPAGCTTAYLKALVGRGGVAAGGSYYPIELTNVSKSACTLYGFPGISFVTAVGGSQIGQSALENPIRPRRLVTLAPGKTASALLQVVNAENYPPHRCKPVTAHWLKVYPPGETSALYYGFTALICSSTVKSVHTLSVGTMQPGKTGL
jgi:Protein of unknown function (DUF4232)